MKNCTCCLVLNPFKGKFRLFIERFGHLSDSGNDFSAVPWRDRPDLILRMIADEMPTQSPDWPEVKFDQLKLPSHRRLFIGPVYRLAGRYRWYREAVSSLYTFGYGQFRDHFLALGDHFARRGVIASRDDIFYLSYEEVVRGGGERSWKFSISDYC